MIINISITLRTKMTGNPCHDMQHCILAMYRGLLRHKMIDVLFLSRSAHNGVKKKKIKNSCSVEIKIYF